MIHKLYRLKFFGICLMFFMAMSCDKQELLPDGQLKIKFNKTKTAVENEVKIRFESLEEDSRCPLNAYCIWEGQATVKLKFNDADESSLTLRSGENELNKLILDGYEYTLIDVLPYPDADKKRKDKDYEIIIQVEKQ